jgi:hypothetical protein
MSGAWPALGYHCICALQLDIFVGGQHWIVVLISLSEI